MIRFLTPLVLLSLVACAASPTPPLSPSPTHAVAPSPTPPVAFIRPPAVAGEWYPSDTDELARMVDTLLAAAAPTGEHPIALIAPHANYLYSGAIAAAAFKQMEGEQYDVAVIVASDHRTPLAEPISVWAAGGFETPLGVIWVDESLAQAIIAAQPRIAFDPAAHEGEHPIEMELPFLQRVCPACKIVPVLMGPDDEATAQLLADALLAALPGRRAVVIASSDLAHYPAYSDARRVDEAILEEIVAGDPARLQEKIDVIMGAGIPDLMTCACGKGPILTAMKVARGLGADDAAVLAYTNSGDISGDRTQVVGYGAVMFWRAAPSTGAEGQ